MRWSALAVALLVVGCGGSGDTAEGAGATGANASNGSGGSGAAGLGGSGGATSSGSTGGAGGSSSTSSGAGASGTSSSSSSSSTTSSGTGGSEPTCADGQKNQDESDIDCGGSCPTCSDGKFCAVDADCQSAKCVGVLCACGNAHVVISEVRTRGVGGAADEFIELFNPTPNAITFDSSWKIEASVVGNGGASYYTVWTGTFNSIQPFGHFLLVSASASAGGAPNNGSFPDAFGVTDATAIRLVHSGAVEDGVCIYYGQAALAELQTNYPPLSSYACDSSLVPNSHDDTAATNANTSVERKPGGGEGNCLDSGAATDWQTISPANPQTSADPATP